MGLPGGTVVKNPLAYVEERRDTDSTPGSGISLGVGNGNLLQYSCLENSMDRGAWQATVHEVTKNQTRMSMQHSNVKASSFARLSLTFSHSLFQ